MKIRKKDFNDLKQKIAVAYREGDIDNATHDLLRLTVIMLERMWKES